MICGRLCIAGGSWIIFLLSCGTNEIGDRKPLLGKGFGLLSLGRAAGIVPSRTAVIMLQY
jgi:hypothetical protein